MDQTKRTGVAVVAGVGPGLGAALARRFAEGYAVAMIARRAEYLRELGDEIRASGASAMEVPADLSDAAQVEAAFRAITERLGVPDVLIYNAGNFPFGGIVEVTRDQFESAWKVNALGAFLCAKQVVDAMIRRGSGTILMTGATAGVKAGARSAAFGPAKFAVRGLAQSMARDLGPRGIHVAYINVDGVIDLEATRRRFSQLKPEDMLSPAAIAETYWHLAHQDRSAWTMETELRPFKEKF
jgi:NADP-dependent 3-hydroxy acid dehydrogenase YdfG